MKAPSEYRPALYRYEGTATTTNRYGETNSSSSKRAVVVVASEVEEAVNKIRLAIGENNVLWFHTVTELTTEEAEKYR